MDNQAESTVQTVTVQVVVCKESTEVFDAAAGLVKAIKAGKPVAEIIASELVHIMSAVEGFDKLSDEAKSENFYETAGLGGAKLTKALLGK